MFVVHDLLLNFGHFTYCILAFYKLFILYCPKRHMLNCHFTGCNLASCYFVKGNLTNCILPSVVLPMSIFGKRNFTN
jgi:hypothetical protein